MWEKEKGIKWKGTAIFHKSFWTLIGNGNLMMGPVFLWVQGE